MVLRTGNRSMTTRQDFLPWLPDDPSMVAKDPLPALKEGGGKFPTPFLSQFVSISRREYPVRSTRCR